MVEALTKDSGMVNTTSGLMCQPSAKTGVGGRSFGSPSLAPVSTQEAMVAISASDRRGSLMKSPTLGSACHGGILRATTASRIGRAQIRLCLYVISDMGAISLGRWQTTQFLKKIGATSRLKVTSLGGLGLSFLAPRNKALKATATRTNIVLRGPMCPPATRWVL